MYAHHSYATIYEATDFLRFEPEFGRWTDLSVVQQEAALVSATRKVDTRPMAGVKTDESQLLKFPRRGQSTVPVAVKQAVILEALASCDKEATLRANLMAQGVSSVHIGHASESYTGANKKSALHELFISQRAALLLKPYLRKGVPLV